MRRSLTVLFTIVLVAALGWAQAAYWSDHGHGRRSDGCRCGRSRVTVTNPSTNSQRAVKTNGSGVYDAPALPPGRYNLKAEMPGFTTQVRNDIELQVAQVARIDVVLQVGNVTDVVEVTGGAPVLQTETTAIGTVVENRRIEDFRSTAIICSLRR